MGKTWVYYKPKFESDLLNKEMMTYSPWSGHRNFAYDYVRNIVPRRIVELGSYYGCSSFAFLQAIKDACVDTEFVGIDTWKGDSFTVTDYQEDIYGAFKIILERYFSEQNGKMLRSTFDDACLQFEEHSIDLLHIDGSHKYDDVKHDFILWKDKVKPDGLILFHDISNDLLYGEVMGSHLFWEEIKKEYPYTLEFKMSFGLGLLFFDLDKYEYIKDCVKFEKYQKQIFCSDNENKDTIRRYFFETRNLKKRIEELEQQLEDKQTHISAYEIDVKEKSSYISILEGEIDTLTKKCRQTFEEQQHSSNRYESDIRELSLLITNYNEDVKAKQKYIFELEAALKKETKKVEDLFTENQELAEELRQTISKFNLFIDGKEKYIQELLETIKKYKLTEERRISYTKELEEVVKDYQKTVEGKNSYIQELLETIDKYKLSEKSRVSYIKELEEAINDYQKTVEGKDNYIQELLVTIEKYKNTETSRLSYISELEKTIADYKKNVEGKEAYIQELLATISDYVCLDQKKTEYINELREAVEKYEESVKGKNAYIAELVTAIDGYKKAEAERQQYIINLEDGLSKYEKNVSQKDSYIEELLETIRGYEDLKITKEEEIICLSTELSISKNQINQLRDSYNQKEEELNAIYAYLKKTIVGKMILNRMGQKL